ncbi:PREDICTED: MATH domain and coiled-coil domain-containing protein At1g31390-like [Tarenaya hassleriana]|uniref:MATH domain and coiled-coil domain-containing protein At1g31390-like n=1 Tax=Tarenaya hassleriana TaxID=28532 RepID=UPI00053C0FAB|nr:PREDICTED: MATH domain and coiled-coil domain-containing protein At1g31390-like [Tarenaya hassleriana]
MANNKFSWTILQFSRLQDKFYYSDGFLVGDRYWRIGFNPKGDGGSRSTILPVYLFAYGFAPNVPTTTTLEEVYLRLKDQRNSNHKQIYSWYPVRTGYNVGVNTIISFQELFDQSKGYLVNDRIVFEVEMPMVSATNIVPN